MKRFWAVFVCLLALVLLGGQTACASGGTGGRDLLRLDEAVHVSLQSGRTFAEIDDPAVHSHLREMFYAPVYEKDQSSEGWVGWSYALTWYDKKGEPVEEIVVQGEGYVNYDGWFQTLSGGRLDFQYFEKLLLPFHVTEDLGELVKAIRGERLLGKDFLEEKEPDAFMVEKDGRRAVFTDPEVVRQSIEMFDWVRVRRAWADGTQEPEGFYVLTWGDKTNAPDMPVFEWGGFWYRPGDHIFRQYGYACTLERGSVDTAYLDRLLAEGE